MVPVMVNMAAPATNKVTPVCQKPRQPGVQRNRSLNSQASIAPELTANINQACR